MRTSTSSTDLATDLPTDPSTDSRLLRVALPAVFWLAVWWGLAAWIDQELLVPSPAAVAGRLAELAMTMHFWHSVGISLLRIFCGAACGVALGSLCAVLTCRYKTADWLISPAIRVIRATPVASFIILVLLWVPTGTVPGVISALMVLPIMWESVAAGIRAADPLLLEFARAYRLSRRRTLRHVWLPAVLPLFGAGICNAIGLAWKSGVAAEVLCLPKAAIGTEVFYAKIYLETPSLFAWSIMVIVLSLLLEHLIRRLLAAEPTVRGGRRI